MIKLVLGLGNPGEEYKETRHNIGFTILDELVRRLKLKEKRRECLSLIYRANIGGKKLLLAKPQTYMNNSGYAVINILEEYSLEPNEMLVVHDDLDLPFGYMRLRLEGSSAGHRGVESIINSIKSQNFPRLRIGIGRPAKGEDIARYVLSPFSPEEKGKLGIIIDKAVKCILRSVELSPEVAMEFCNRRDTV